MGTILDILSSEGNIHVIKDELIKCTEGFRTEYITNFNNLIGISSYSLDECIF